MIEALSRVIEVIPRTPSIKSFRLETPEQLVFKPGQFLTLTLEQNNSLRRCLSFSNSPTEQGYIEVTKRITDSDFSQILNQVQPGYELHIRCPLGKFTFDGEFKKICLLSGGIGITPLRSICKYIVDKQLDTDTCLLYANRSEEEIAFKDDFDEMAEQCSRLKVVHTLDQAGESWSGRRGRIDAQMVQEEVPDFLDRQYFICGPPKMVKAMAELLKEQLAMPEEQVRTENFSGY